MYRDLLSNLIFVTVHAYYFYYFSLKHGMIIVIWQKKLKMMVLGP